MKHKFALNYLMSQVWALDQRLLSFMSNVANRDANSLSLDDFAPMALAGKVGKTLTRGMEKREGGIAMIHVNGVISRYANLFTDVCGATTTQLLAQDFTTALNDPSVKSILLNMDSPGGEAKGIHEFAEMIYQARGKKPIIAYIGGDACSAAYWIASAADEVIIDATGTAGSIGTVLEMQLKKPSDDDAYETIEIVSSQSPNKRQDPRTEAGRAAYQKHLDDLSEVFIQRVARNMNVSRDHVINEFGGGGFFIGQEAVDKKMAHRLGSLESLISELKTGNKKKMPDPTTNAQENEGHITLSLPTSSELNASDLISVISSQRPDVVEALSTPTVEMALSHAASIVQQCASAGVPALSATLLKDGVTQASAEHTIKMAGQLKNTLSAAGLSGSFDALLSNIDDPIKMVGMAIHEAKAESDESGDQTRQIIDKPKSSTKLKTSDIYASRK